MWPSAGGWFVLNAREARWNHRPGRQSVTFTGKTEFEADTYFPQLGVNLAVFEPGEDTQDGDIAYANVPESEPTRYRDGWLPST